MNHFQVNRPSWKSLTCPFFLNEYGEIIHTILTSLDYYLASIMYGKCIIEQRKGNTMVKKMNMA